jgi:hypothetical protein
LRQLLAIAAKTIQETTAVVEKTQKAKRNNCVRKIALTPVPQGFLAFFAFVKYCFLLLDSPACVRCRVVIARGT